MFYIKIPVKPHVFRFVEVNFGHPYEIKGNDYLGMTIINLLRRPIQDNRRLDQVMKYGMEMTTILKRKHVINWGMLHGLDPQSVVVLNHKIDKIIENLFIGIMDARMDMGDRVTNAINYFIRHHNYFDESSDSFEMLRKRYYRYERRKMKEKEEKSLPQMSQRFEQKYGKHFDN